MLKRLAEGFGLRADETSAMLMRVADAHCKINFGLDVLGERADGFHDLRTIMVKFLLCDQIRVQADFSEPLSAAISPDSCRIEIGTDDSSVPSDRTNLAHVAAVAYIEALARCGLSALIPKSIAVSLTKRIPSGAGLGGGSSDAATVLKALHSLVLDRAAGLVSAPDEPDFPDLAALALKVGSDVPFFLGGSAAVAEGRGEILSPFELGKKVHAVLAMPSEKLLTRDVFALYKRVGCTARPNIKAIRKWLLSGGVVAPPFSNALEEAASILLPQIRAVKHAINATNPLQSGMTGSGCCVYGVYESDTKADRAYKAVSEHAKVAWCTKTRSL